MWHVENTIGEVTINGDATVNGEGLITQFNGNINSTEGKNGYFNYNEDSNNKVNRNYNGDKEIESQAISIIDATVADIKLQVQTPVTK
jgi:hypothetical protein